MKIRKFSLDTDFDIIKNWSTDAKTHALWCANRMQYPPDIDNVGSFLRFEEEKYGNKAYMAENDEGKAVGFYCCSAVNEDGEAMLKFVIVDPNQRGNGYGKEMIRLAVEKEFESDSVKAVQLMVFTSNVKAQKCYESVGFRERSVTPDVFTFENESWGRSNMVITR